MKYAYLTLLLTLFWLNKSWGQTVFWSEDFNGATSNWTVENAPGSKTNPTPAGIAGLSYIPNQAGNNYFIINDANTPELNSGDNAFVRGRKWNCSAPNNLPNPYPGSGVQNKSLHITARASSDGAQLGTLESPDYGDEYSFTNTSTGADGNSDQYAFLKNNINTQGRCNMKLEADFFLGGDSNHSRSYATILYSIDGGSTWKIMADNIGPALFFIAGTCNNWERLSFSLPAECENITTLRLAFRWRNDNSDPMTTADYTIGASFNVDNVNVSTTDAPVVDFTASNLTPCKNEIVTFSDATNVNGVLNATYAWTITPGTITYVQGTSATDVNPKVKFTANGNYTVSLAVTNCAGTIIQTKTNYISVGNCLPLPDITVNRTQTCIPNPAPVVAGSPTSVVLNALNYNTYLPCTGGCVPFTWAFNPSNGVSYISGNANAPVIEVQFANAGTYDVTLTAQNDDGTQAITKTSLISAINCQCTVPTTSSGGNPEQIYYENFDAYANLAGSGWTSANLTTPWGNGSFFGLSNNWQLSDDENGMAEGACGAADLGNKTLYMGSNASAGAAYLADVNTNRRISSPNINTVGKTNLTLSFRFIGNGEGTTDKGYLVYSTNGGGAWTAPTGAPTSASPAMGAGGALDNLKSQICGGGQGKWTTLTWTLPATCENIANLRIGFVWQNNNNSLGTDPSFAVDEIKIMAGSGGGGGATDWTGASSNAWNLASNWSAGVPTTTSIITIPSVAPNMPVVSAPVTVERITIQSGGSLTVASGSLTAKGLANSGSFSLTGGNATFGSVCNNNLITITGNAAPNNYQMAVNGFLNNNGQITTTSLDSLPDVVLNKNSTDSSIYRGVGTNVGVDYLILNSGGTDFTTLQANLSCRSIRFEGDLNMTGRTLTLKKSFVHQSGVITFTNSTVLLDGSGGVPLDGDGLQVVRHNNGAGSLAFSTFNIVKTLGPVIVQSSFQISQGFRLETNKFVEVQPSGLLWLLNSVPASLTRINGHIVGKFRRNISGVAEYEFPLGNKPYYQGAFLKTLANLVGVSQITGEFINTPNIIGSGFNQIDVDLTYYTQGVVGPGYWQLTPNAQPSGGTYELAVYPAIDFTNPGGGASVTLAKRTDSFSAWGLTGTPVAVSWPQVRRSAYTSFSDFFPVTDAKPLAVESSALTAHANGPKTIKLDWTTFSETNNEGFLLERTTDLSAGFMPLTFVKSKAGANGGNKNGGASYVYLDKAVTAGVTYFYRYKQIDLDGATAYSNVTSAQIPTAETALDVSVYPNPTAESTTFTFNTPLDGRCSFSLTDGAGREIARQIFDAKTPFVWQKGATPAGIYYYRIQNGTKFASGKLIVRD